MQSYSQPQLNINLIPDPPPPTSGENISRVENTRTADTPATDGADQTVLKPCATVATSRPWKNSNTSPGNENEPTSELLPEEIRHVVGYAYSHSAVEAFLFLGSGILQTMLGKSDIDTGTWLCLRFLEPIKSIPGEIIIITHKTPTP